MENQTKKEADNEMETGFMQGYLGEHYQYYGPSNWIMESRMDMKIAHEVDTGSVQGSLICEMATVMMLSWGYRV